MRQSITLSLALVGGLVATAALAQQPAPPPGALGAAAGAEAPPPPPPRGTPGAVAGVEAPPPPPPPGGPSPDRPPPPPGAHVRLDREANGVVRVDVHCAQQDTTKDCAAIASRLIADTTAAQSGK